MLKSLITVCRRHQFRFVPFVIRLLIVAISFFVYPILAPSNAARTYRCQDTSGVIVLTDSPAQLEHCTILSEGSSANSPITRSSSPPVTPSQDSTPSPTSDDVIAEDDINHEYRFTDDESVNALDEQAEVAIIPVTPYGGSLLVTVRLNHTREAQLILDTGATMTVLSNDVALDLGLIASTNTQLTTVNTAGGQIQVNISQVSSLQAGTAEVNNVDVAIHDLPDSPDGIDGLLGMSFLNHFLVTLDTNQQQLHLKPRS